LTTSLSIFSNGIIPTTGYLKLRQKAFPTHQVWLLIRKLMEKLKYIFHDIAIISFFEALNFKMKIKNGIESVHLLLVKKWKLDLKISDWNLSLVKKVSKEKEINFA
jgi:hypothetical protein